MAFSERGVGETTLWRLKSCLPLAGEGGALRRMRSIPHTPFRESHRKGKNIFRIFNSHVVKGNDEARACAALVHLHRGDDPRGPAIAETA